MTPPPLSAAAERVLAGQEGFSLFLGGPLYQILRRVRLTDDALRLLRRRIIVISLAAWLPLLLLSLLEGHAMDGVAIPFLLDVEAHARFLVAVPLLIAAEFFVQERVRAVPQLFLERRLVPEAHVPRFLEAVAAAYRLRNSVLAEVLLLLFVYGVGVMVIWRGYVALAEPSWYATAEGGLTWAGLWFGLFSLPVFQFLICRWYFRIFIWVRLLWQMSRIPLALMPMHPDRVGGLGFLSLVVQGFLILASAHGALLASLIADRILHSGATLPSFVAEIAALVLFVLGLALLPLCVFAGQLAAAKRQGQREYGTLAAAYVRAFDAKWVRGNAPPDEPLIGSADIQSLADLANSFEVVAGMRVVPITRAEVVSVVAATLLPMAPLLLTMMPIEQLIQGLFGLVF